MKKLMIMSASVIALGALAQEAPVPPPVVTAEATIAVPSVPAVPVVPVPVAVPVPAVAVAESLVDLQPGALCKTYLVEFGSRTGSTRFMPAIGSQEHYEQMMAAVERAVASDVAYDVGAPRFDAAQVAKHKCNVAVWEGVLEGKKAGSYVFTVNSGYDYHVEVNDASVGGVGQKSFPVNLKVGVNKIKIVRFIDNSKGVRVVGRDGRDPRIFSIDYRFTVSTKPARPIAPSMLQHIVDDDNNDEW